MAEQVTITNLPDSGSRARVAWDITKYLIGLLPDQTSKEEKIKAVLDLYADAYDATGGGRRTTR